eukprot:c22095_g1_i2 orf=122-1444(-)
MSNYNYNYYPHTTTPNNQGGSSIIDNMQDLINSHKRKLDPTSAESSTCSHLRLDQANINFNKNSRINFKLKKLEPHIRGSGRKISIKKSIDIDNKSNSINNRIMVIKDAKTYDVLFEKMMMIDGEVHNTVCSMCGDVGVAELLFLCIKCSHRHQHIYCSRSYPDMGREASMCNWCLHEEDSLTSSTAMVTMANKTTAHTDVNQIKEHNHRPPAHLNQSSSLIKELNQFVQDDEDDAEHMVMVKKGHSKAFECLLLVAAQSLPQDNQLINEANPELKQFNTASIINITNQVISEASPELKQANHPANMINITNPKMGASVYKRNIDLDMKVKMGPLDSNKVNMISDKKANINLSDKSIMGLDNSKQEINVNKQNIDLQSKLNIRLEEQKTDVGGLIGGNVPKRQHYSKGINPSLKCRKKGFPSSPSRPNYRRYKLLADVVF